MTKLQIPVSYRPNLGYVTHSTAMLPKSVTALSLMVLRKRVMVAATKYRRPDEPVSVQFSLDPSAQAENDRRRAAAGL